MSNKIDNAVKEIAESWIANADTTPRKIDIETATVYVGWMDDGELPEFITPESFMNAWNSLIEEE